MIYLSIPAKSITKKIESRTQEPIGIPRLQRWFSFVCRMNIIPTATNLSLSSMNYWGKSLPVRLWFPGFRWKFGESIMITAKRLEILRDSFVDTICLFLAEHLIKIYRTHRQSDFWNGYASDLARVRWVSLPLIARRTVIAGCRIESRNSALVGWSFFWVFACSFRATSAKKA